MMDIGIMQGRLGPPVEERFQSLPRGRWAEEFPGARQAGLASIEWIYDLFGAEENPLATDAGVASVRALSEQHGVEVRSLCADYFMDRPLLRVDASVRAERIATLRWLLGRCAALPIKRVVLPFLDRSRIESAEEIEQVIAIFQAVLPTAERTGIELLLETSLPPPELARLLARLPQPLVKLNYDSGNSASLGYAVREEFAAYGERVGSVHIKDRVRGGSTVPLSRGAADLPALFAELSRVGYGRNLILEAARGIPGDEVAWARQNREFVEKLQRANVPSDPSSPAA